MLRTLPGSVNLESMKRLLLSSFTVLLISIAANAQLFTSTVEPGGTKILNGIISRSDLATEPSFSWYAQNQQGYTPFAAAVNALKDKKDSIQYVVFLGTWCGDSKTIVPKFYSLIDAAGVTDKQVSVIGVDRSKKSIGHLTEAFKITNVPTIIAMKNGKEIGRVVEYGKYGMFDKELGEIVISAEAQK